GLLSKAIRTKKIEVNTINPRDFATDTHKTVDDVPYGGNKAGLIMKIEPLVKAIKKAVGNKKSNTTKVVLLSPADKKFSQKIAVEWSKKYDHIVFVCGRYEGVDSRLLNYVDEVVSIGEFVLMGGEVAALAMLEVTSRLIPGVIGNEESLDDESYSDEMYLEYPQYTRPEEYDGFNVPEVLLSGHHGKIEEWRKKNSK
ncbi:MAG: tRNA (guanosine(37)-N1)-methyltransferase TrmD, partial [Patescibacteria group bacterium]|nr:tRNA (guanosine(37)-N1)-methyltransferase TrmD [Patescibacteria group bacterium]